jgi:hypothetical protein
MAIETTKANAQAEAARRGSLNDLGNLLRDIINTLDGLSDTEIAFLDGVVAGTFAASKGMVLDSSGNGVMPATGIFALSRIALAAAGSGQSDAAAITTQVVAVTASDGAKGVALPAAATTTGPFIVINTVATANLLVYPVNGGNDAINALSANAAFTLEPGGVAIFIPTSGTQWYVDYYANVANQKLEVEAAAGITGGTGTVYKSGVQRNGGIISTKILLDITGLGSSTTDGDIIGQGVSAAHIGQITAARNGTTLKGKMTCLEVPATGADDIDLFYATAATGAFDAAISGVTGQTSLISSGGAWTLGQTKGFSAEIPANAYLYLVNGEAGTVGTYTAGQFLIELEGY